MMNEMIQLDENTIEKEHICCAISDKKCAQSYELKKKWLKDQFAHGYVFYRLNERAKVFIEYGPAEYAWLPIEADGYMNINCFWVSGKYKQSGYGKRLLEKAASDARSQGLKGLVTVVGKKKMHFLSDGKWYKNQGFEVCDETADGFQLLVRYTDENSEVDGPSRFLRPHFSESCKTTALPGDGLTVYYSHRCPFAGYHVRESLVQSAEKRGIPLKIVHLDTREKAQNSPSPATIFSLYYKGAFITTDISVCMDSRFDKILKR